jgi:hypothetical protein
MFEALKALFGICTHARGSIFRRNEEGVMGLECRRCEHWSPIVNPPSQVALVMERRQQIERWTRMPRYGWKVAA